MSGISTKRREYWRQVVAEQEKSGKSVRAFCQERAMGEYSFYTWRKKLQKEEPVSFALVNTGRVAEAGAVELVLTSGDRLRIPSDVATLRIVLSVLRERA